MDELINKTRLLKKTNNFMDDMDATWRSRDVLRVINSMPVVSLGEVLEEKYNLEELLHDAVNELCGACGRYRSEHLGYCDGCKWREYRCE